MVKPIKANAKRAINIFEKYFFMVFLLLFIG